MIPTQENTTQSPGLILKLNILQKRDEVLDAIGTYYKNGNKKRSVKSKVKAKAKIFLLELKPVLMRYKEWDKVNGKDIDSFDDLVKFINSSDVDDVIKGFEAIDIILDRKNLTMWDNRKPLDTFNLESENLANHT